MGVSSGEESGGHGTVRGSDSGGDLAGGSAWTHSYLLHPGEPQRLEPAERELFVQAETSDGLLLRGFVDRLDVAPDGAMRVVDYKTGRSPGTRFVEEALFQMRFYALVLWRLRGQARPASSWSISRTGES